MSYRAAVRALLVADQEVLLVRLYVPDTKEYIWLAPGGGIEPSEDHLAALEREVWEETGHQEPSPRITGPVWHRRHAFVFRGESFDQEEFFYYWPVEKFVASGEQNPAEHEAELLDELRWWSVAEIAASDETFVPLTMAEHLRALLAERPTAVIEVGL
ncbi:MAG: NUDIX domain-containing protein [Pseudomonadales bacterium]|nr:NUDIX domain-containing protein [Pseudomonadales bacterium]